MEPEIYILSFNGATLYVSKNVKTLWAVLWARCTNEKREHPDQYATVRRSILKTGAYSHTPLAGWNYIIEKREMLKKPHIIKNELFQDVVVKQS